MSGMKTVRVKYAYDSNDAALLDALFAGIFRFEPLSDVILEQERKENASKFANQFTDNIFRDEYAILYELAFIRRLTTGKWPVMAAVIEENKEVILNSSQVHISELSSEYSDSDQYDSFISITKGAYERICAMPFPGSEGFRTAVNAFIEAHGKKYARACLSVAGGIANSPVPYIDYRSGRRREYQGYQGAMDFIVAEKNRIDALRNAQRVRQFVLDEEWLLTQFDQAKREEQAKRTELLCKLGLFEIDSVWSGLRRSRFIGINGPPKGGKTSLAAYMVHRLLKEGRRVCVWAMEGSARESWINKLVAAICFEEGHHITTQDLEEHYSDLSEDTRRYVDLAKFELAQEGRLSFIEETGYVEDFLDIIDGHYRSMNKFDAIVVDSLLNLQTKTGRYKTEYLSAAYISLKDYIGHKLDTPPVCIATAQIKQEAIKEARNSAEIDFDETSGGETSETFRTPDEVITIFGTSAQKEVNRTTLYHSATRHTKQFKKFNVIAMFGCATFQSEKA
jgi:hypothetical protein